MRQGELAVQWGAMRRRTSLAAPQMCGHEQRPGSEENGSAKQEEAWSRDAKEAGTRRRLVEGAAEQGYCCRAAVTLAL